MKITKLTAEQSAKLDEYRTRCFDRAVSTSPADRPRAEAAARRLAEIGGVVVQHVVWVDSPQDGRREVDAVWDSPGASLGASLSASLSASLNAPLRDSLSDSLRDSLSDSLWDSLCDSLNDSPSDSLRDSLRDSLWDSGWICYYGAARDVLGVQYDERSAELLHLHEEIAESCFALWIVPGAVVLCERPLSVTVEGKGEARKLTGIEWRAALAASEGHDARRGEEG